MAEAAAVSSRRRRSPAMSPTTRIPTATRTGSSRSTGRSRRSRSTSTRTAASAPATSSSSTRTTWASTSSSPTRCSGSASSIPRCAASSSPASRERIFCSGANIFMLGLSSHAWKVNFCKFTNETRNGIEDSSRHSGLKFVAACNGTTAGGGYELALACDEILLIDDRSSAVSLPEVPLLGVLPGTGGLTRVTDKRRVRRDHADIFCTLVEGVRAQRAKEWRLIDDHAKPQQFAAKVNERALALAARATGRRTRRASRCRRSRGRSTTPASTTRTSTSASTARRGPRRSPCRRRSRRRRPISRRSTRRAPRGGRSRWRASSTTRSCSCAPTSPSSAPGS